MINTILILIFFLVFLYGLFSIFSNFKNARKKSEKILLKFSFFKKNIVDCNAG